MAMPDGRNGMEEITPAEWKKIQKAMKEEQDADYLDYIKECSKRQKVHDEGEEAYRDHTRVYRTWKR
jgi:hypothetical protein